MAENPYAALASMMDGEKNELHMLEAVVVALSPMRLQAGAGIWDEADGEVLPSKMLGWRPPDWPEMQVGARVLCLTSDYQRVYALCEVER